MINTSNNYINRLKYSKYHITNYNEAFFFTIMNKEHNHFYRVIINPVYIDSILW